MPQYIEEKMFLESLSKYYKDSGKVLNTIRQLGPTHAWDLISVSQSSPIVPDFGVALRQL
jgi:hypothetical protein